MLAAAAITRSLKCTGEVQELTGRKTQFIMTLERPGPRTSYFQQPVPKSFFLFPAPGACFFLLLQHSMGNGKDSSFWKRLC